MKRFTGITLPELLVVIAVLAIVGTATMQLFLRASLVYTSTSAHSGPQSAEILAIKRMETEIREAMFVSVVTPTPSTWAEISLPQKDTTTNTNFIVKGDKGILGLVRDPARDSCFFLGRKEFPDPSNTASWNAVPDENGHTIFKALSSTITTENKFPNAEVVIDGVLSTPMVPDPAHPGQWVAGRIFEYWPSDPNDPTRPTVDSQLLRISITVPVSKRTLAGVVTENHTVQTQFCLRNWNSSQVPQ